MNAPLLEFVGFDKLSKRQREFHKLRVISVRGHLVDRDVKKRELRNPLYSTVYLNPRSKSR